MVSSSEQELSSFTLCFEQYRIAAELIPKGSKLVVRKLRFPHFPLLKRGTKR